MSTDLQALGTAQLRRLAAYMGIGSIGGRSLKYARKAELIAALTQNKAPAVARALQN